MSFEHLYASKFKVLHRYCSLPHILWSLSIHTCIRSIVLTHYLFKTDEVLQTTRHVFEDRKLFDVGWTFFFYFCRDEIKQKCLLVWFFKIHRMCATAGATILAKTAETFRVSSQGKLAWRQENRIKQLCDTSEAF